MSTSAAIPTADTPRRDGRTPAEIRPIAIQRSFTRVAPGSVLMKAGETVVLCTASVEEVLPPWAKKDSTRGWLTAEYNMLPGSTLPRKPRERAGKTDGRTTEIQRLIGRSLRAVVDLQALGPRTIHVDCDVLQADGGTRTLSITGGFIALCDAVASLRPLLTPGTQVITNSIAAISVGIIQGRILLDLDYSEDNGAEVDFNVVMTGSGEYVEVQGTAEGKPFTQSQLDGQLAMARVGIEKLRTLQHAALAENWPL